MNQQLLFFVLVCIVAEVVSNFSPVERDNRYPDHIKNDPRVHCNVVGSFPHPADCSWFYRCVDNLGINYFRVYFFKCEPGTIFHDDLDQCVPGSANQCDNLPITTGLPVNSTPYPTSTPTPSPPSTGAPTQPPIQPPTPSPTQPQTQAPTESPVTSPSPPVPTTTEDSVNGGNAPYTCSVCIETEVCTGEVNGVQRLCKVCTIGNLFTINAEERCNDHPDPYLLGLDCIYAKDMCPVRANVRQEGPTVTYSPGDQLEHTFQCTESNSRPFTPRIEDLFCSHYHYCSPFGLYLGTKKLCSNFYQCYKTGSGSWDAEVENCKGSYLYSYDSNLCVPEPKAMELCSNSIRIASHLV